MFEIEYLEIKHGIGKITFREWLESNSKEKREFRVNVIKNK